jgi:hypothetical protein
MLKLRTSLGLTHIRGPTEEQQASLRGLGAFEETSVGKHGKDKTMGRQHEADLIKRLEQLGIEVDVSPTVITITYKQISTSGSTLEEAVVTFLGEALSRYEALRERRGLTPLLFQGRARPAYPASSVPGHARCG